MLPRPRASRPTVAPEGIAGVGAGRRRAEDGPKTDRRRTAAIASQSGSRMPSIDRPAGRFSTRARRGSPRSSSAVWRAGSLLDDFATRDRMSELRPMGRSANRDLRRACVVSDRGSGRALRGVDSARAHESRLNTVLNAVVLRAGRAAPGCRPRRPNVATFVASVYRAPRAASGQGGSPR
jgi:hypothetical protein